MALTPAQRRRLEAAVKDRRPPDSPPDPEAAARWRLALLSPATAKWAERFRRTP